MDTDGFADAAVQTDPPVEPMEISPIKATPKVSTTTTQTPKNPPVTTVATQTEPPPEPLGMVVTIMGGMAHVAQIH